MRKSALLIAAIFLFVSGSSVLAFEPDTGDELQLSVAKAILDLKNADPGMEKFFENSAGYAVFPRVGKGGIGIGGAGGKGLVIVGEKAVGRTSLSAALT